MYKLNQEKNSYEILNMIDENLIEEEMRDKDLMDEDKKIFQVIIQMEDLRITFYLEEKKKSSG
jgi:hypothetical protein